MSDKGLKEVKKTSIGGQALIEGIMKMCIRDRILLSMKFQQIIKK